MQLAFSSDRTPSAKVNESCHSVFWVAPRFFDSTLTIVPPFGSGAVCSQISIFDGSGELANEVEVLCPGQTVTALSLAPFLAACKVHGGLVSAQVRVSSPKGTLHHCKLSSAGIENPKMRTLSGDSGLFYPLQFSAGLSTFLAATNPGPQPAKFALRLFLGNRTPEVTKELFPGCSTVLSVRGEFEEFLGQKSKHRAYLRVRARSNQSVLITMFDEIDSNSRPGEA